MTTESTLEITLEGQAFPPNHRYDLEQPLLQGRVPIEGVTIRPSGAMQPAGYFDNPKFKEGDFGLLDINVGDVVPAIEEGWDMVCLPVFNKRKPVYNYLWVRADLGIESPKDLEGKTFATVGYASSISTFSRGLLQRFFGVDLTKLRWLLPAPGPFPLYRGVDAQMTVATGERKSPIQRLLDGEVDASTGDITDASFWAALEGSDQVKRLFPDYQAMNKQLWLEHRVHSPTHIIVMGGRLNREHPELARKLYDAFVESKRLAVNDALGDGTSYSMLMHAREAMRDQLAEWGDVYPMGIAANRNTIDWFLDFNVEQGLTKERMTDAQVFAAGTLDT
jgi:ABC-type nitrate/sulfonate/bicarbonate transport system substrate-binding protein